MPETFVDLIRRNKRDSAILMVVFVLLVAIVAAVLGSAISGDLTHAVFVGAAAMVVSLGISLLSYYGGAGVVLAVSGAKEIQHSDDPQLFNVVEEMAIAAGLPMPKVYLIADPAPNAFATGRDPAHAVVAVTTGLRQKLTRDELQGVVAHEMSHVRNYDIRYAMLVAVMVGTIVMLCDLFLRLTWFSGGRIGGRGSKSSSSSDKKGGAMTAIIYIVAILLAIIAPILAKLIQLAVSRHREYLADASGVELTRNPLGLAGALKKIVADGEVPHSANRGTQHLYIVNPLWKESGWRSNLLATHPPIQDRIDRLLALAHEYPAGAVQAGA